MYSNGYRRRAKLTPATTPYGHDDVIEMIPFPTPGGNCWSSIVNTNPDDFRHRPVLDLDYPCEVRWQPISMSTDIILHPPMLHQGNTEAFIHGLSLYGYVNGAISLNLTRQNPGQVYLKMRGGFHLRPSRTVGHNHLFMEGGNSLTGVQYDHILEMAMTAGIIQPGYYEAYRRNGQSLVRMSPDERAEQEARLIEQLLVPNPAAAVGVGAPLQVAVQDHDPEF